MSSTRRPPNRPKLRKPSELGQPAVWDTQIVRRAHQADQARPAALTQLTGHPSTLGTLDLWLPINPVPLERARIITTYRDGQTRTRGHTPARTAAFYAELAWSITSLHLPIITTPIQLKLDLWRHLPTPRAQRGDLSNLVKAIEDALNGHLWDDDRQIISLTATLRAAGRTIPGAIHLQTRPHQPPVGDPA